MIGVGLLGLLPFIYGALDRAHPLRILLDGITTLLVDFLTKSLTGLTAGAFLVTDLDFSNPVLNPSSSQLWTMMSAISLFLVTGLFMLAVINAIGRGSWALMPQAIGGIGLALLIPQAAAVVVPMLSTFVARLSAWIVTTSVQGDLALALQQMALLHEPSGYQLLGPLVPVILLAYVWGVFTLFMMLWVIKVLGAVAYLMVPLAAAGLAGPPATRAWMRRWGSLQTGIILAPLITAITLAVAVGMFAHAGDGAGDLFTTLSVGAAGLLLFFGAIGSPLVGVALFSWAGGGITHGVGGAYNDMKQRLTSGAKRVANAKPVKDAAASIPKKVGASNTADTADRKTGPGATPKSATGTAPAPQHAMSGATPAGPGATSPGTGNTTGAPPASSPSNALATSPTGANGATATGAPTGATTGATAGAASGAATGGAATGAAAGGATGASAAAAGPAAPAVIAAGVAKEQAVKTKDKVKDTVRRGQEHAQALAGDTEQPDRASSGDEQAAGRRPTPPPAVGATHFADGTPIPPEPQGE